MTVDIVDIDEGFDDFFDSVRRLTSKEVKIGYDQDSGSSGNIGLADLAIIHEFGTKIGVTKKMRGYLGANGLHLKASTTEITIPARPAVRQSFDNNQQEISDFGVELLGKYLDGQIDAELTYEAWGDFYKGKLQNGITSRELGLEENHSFTIDRKGSDTPLVDSGRLVNGSKVKVAKK